MSINYRSPASSFEILENPETPRKTLEMQWKIALLEHQVKDLQKNPPINIESIKEALSGQWKLQSSTNLDQFLSHNELTDFDEIKFRLADYFVVFPNENSVSASYKVGENSYNAQDLELSKPYFHENFGSMTYITGDGVKTITIYGSNSNVEKTEELRVLNGSLELTQTSDGYTCIRTYSKEGESEISELQKTVKDLKFENEMLKGQLDRVSEIYQNLQLADVKKLQELAKTMKILEANTILMKESRNPYQLIEKIAQFNKIWTSSEKN